MLTSIRYDFKSLHIARTDKALKGLEGELDKTLAGSTAWIACLLWRRLLRRTLIRIQYENEDISTSCKGPRRLDQLLGVASRLLAVTMVRTALAIIKPGTSTSTGWAYWYSAVCLWTRPSCI